MIFGDLNVVGAACPWREKIKALNCLLKRMWFHWCNENMACRADTRRVVNEREIYFADSKAIRPTTF